MRKIYNFFCLIILVISIFNAPLFSQGDAGQAGEFLRYGVGSRALALGSAFGALADDATASYWNPAGIAQLEEIQLSLMYSRLIFNDIFWYFGGIAPRIIGSNPHFSFGASITSLETDGYEERDESNNYYGKFYDIQRATLLTAAIHFSLWAGRIDINSGINYKYITHNIAGLNHYLPSDNLYSTSGLDWGIIIKSGPEYPDIRFGLTYQNIIKPKIKFISDTDQYPSSQRYSFVYKIEVDSCTILKTQDLNNLNISPIFDLFVINNSKRKISFNIGCEFKILNKNDTKHISLRLGFREIQNFNNFALGIGFKCWPFLSLDFCYLYQSSDILTSSNFENFTLSFYPKPVDTE